MFDGMIRHHMTLVLQAGEIADLLCGKMTTPKEFAAKYGMLETEANSFREHQPPPSNSLMT